VGPAKKAASLLKVNRNKPEQTRTVTARGTLFLYDRHARARNAYIQNRGH